MNKKLPKVYANKIDKKLKNNETVYHENGKVEEKKQVESLDVYKKINKIFSSSRYVYKAEVVITLNSGKVVKKIIGRNENELITMDSEVIKIKDILDIEFKD